MKWTGLFVALVIAPCLLAQEPPPDAVLRNLLQLDDAQVTHLQEIVVARHTAMTSTARQMQELQAQLEQALATSSADPAAVGKIVLSIRALTEESGRQQETFRAAFAASLTAEQRQRVETMRTIRAALAGASALERLGL